LREQMNRCKTVQELPTDGRLVMVSMDRFVFRTPVGIRFGAYVFSNPVPLNRFMVPLHSAGLFVVLLPDPSWGPWRLQPLFFGEFGGHQDAHMSPAEQLACLKIAAGRSLYVAMYAVPQQYESELSRIKRELIERYQPLSNQQSIDAAVNIRSRLD